MSPTAQQNVSSMSPTAQQNVTSMSLTAQQNVSSMSPAEQQNVRSNTLKYIEVHVVRKVNTASPINTIRKYEGETTELYNSYITYLDTEGRDMRLLLGGVVIMGGVSGTADRLLLPTAITLDVSYSTCGRSGGRRRICIRGNLPLQEIR